MKKYFPPCHWLLLFGPLFLNMCSSLYLGFVTVFQFVISGVTFQRIFLLSRYSYATSLKLKVVLFVVISRMFYSAQKFSTEDLFLGRKSHFWLSQLDHGCCKCLTMQQGMIWPQISIDESWDSGLPWDVLPYLCICFCKYYSLWKEILIFLSVLLAFCLKQNSVLFMIESFVWVILTDETKVCLVV